MNRTFHLRYVEAGTQALREVHSEATDADTLREATRSQGHTVLSITATRTRAATARPLDRAEVATVCRELRTLIDAGMTVVEAIDSLEARHASTGRAPGLLAQLRAGLSRGQALSEAMADVPGAPPVLLAALRAGERTSQLGATLGDYLRFDDLLERLRKKALSAALYPSLVALLGLGISIFLLMVVLPSFSRMYQQLRGDVAGLSAQLVRLSLAMSEHRALTFLALGIAAVFIAWALRSDAALRVIHRLASRTGWLRRELDHLPMALLFQALALLLRGGLPFTQALTIAASATPQPILRDAALQAREQLMAGAPIAQTLHEAGLCDEIDRRLLAAAERSGAFDRAAEVVAARHGEAFELFVERTARLIEPVLLIAVATWVGGIVVAMYLPVFDLAVRLR